MVNVDKAKRDYNTEFPYLIDNEDGPEEGVLDITKLSDEELLDLIPTIPEATKELYFRQYVLSEPKDN